MRLKFRIREAAEEDIPVVMDLVKRLAVYEKLIDGYTATEELSTGGTAGGRKPSSGSSSLGTRAARGLITSASPSTTSPSQPS